MVSGTIASAAAGVQVVLSLLLVLVAARAWRRVRAKRMGLLLTVFVLFLVQGLLLAWSLLLDGPSLENATAGGMAITSLALLVIYLGVLRP